MNNTTLTVIVSVYNEELGLQEFWNNLHSELAKLPDVEYEILFVNDGSTDNSLTILKQIASDCPQVRVINFTRNFGHEAAMTAGLDFAKGNYCICMDADCQHPASYIGTMLAEAEKGFDVVNMVRTKRADAGTFGEAKSRLFYRLINKISNIELTENASDFFLVSRPVVDVLKHDYKERTRFLRGLIQLVGYNKTTLPYEAPARIAGTSHYSFSKLLRLSFVAISGFSKIPLQLGIISGICFGLLSLVLVVYSLIMWLYDKPVGGYTTLIVFLCIFASIQLFITGIIGQYIGYIFDEVKQRPIYTIKEIF